MRLPKGLSIVSIQDSTIVKLYQTNIVTKIGLKLRLESGGWRTSHTKKCMNLILRQHGLNVYQKNNEWFVSNQDGSTQVFQDGMTIELSQ